MKTKIKNFFNQLKTELNEPLKMGEFLAWLFCLGLLLFACAFAYHVESEKSISFDIASSYVLAAPSAEAETPQKVRLSLKGFMGDGYNFYNFNEDYYETIPVTVVFPDDNTEGQSGLTGSISFENENIKYCRCFIQTNAFGVQLCRIDCTPTNKNGRISLISDYYPDLTSCYYLVYLTEHQIDRFYYYQTLDIMAIFQTYADEITTANEWDIAYLSIIFNIDDKAVFNSYISRKYVNDYLHGLNVGKEQGFDEGFDEGFVEGINSQVKNDDIYQFGYDRGYENGQINMKDAIVSAPNDYGLYTESEKDAENYSWYLLGKQQGAESALENQYTFENLFTAVLDAPLNILFGSSSSGGLLNFDFLGINIANIIKALITIVIIVFIIKLFI